MTTECISRRPRALSRLASLLTAMALVLIASVAGATTIIPMSDADLVGSSDLIAMGDVTAVTSGTDADGRIVTRVAVDVARTLKGRVEGDTIQLTEPGGQVGTRRVVIHGAPEYVVGERVLVFARVGADDTLHTNALSLGRYGIGAGGSVARRSFPSIDERGLDDFVARIESLVPAGPPTLVPSGGDGGAQAANFTLAVNGELPGRWFESDCGTTVNFSLLNVDPVLGDAATRASLSSAIGAWTEPTGASLRLGVGPDGPPGSFQFFDGINGILFEDPFGDIEDPLVNCAGVLAIGGFVSDSIFGMKEVNGQTFGRIIEGDVVMNVGTSACISASGVDEVLAHEIGHAIGFAHSSENFPEPNPVLEDALMFWLAHDDGRGARLGTDDIEGLEFIYPPVPSVDPVTDAVASYSCQVSFGPLGSGCSREVQLAGGPVTIPAAPFNKFEKAGKIAAKAVAKPRVKKQRKLVKKSRKQLLGAQKKATKLAAKGKLLQGCAEDVQAATQRGIEKADETIAILEANL